MLVMTRRSSPGALLGLFGFTDPAAAEVAPGSPIGRRGGVLA